MKISYIGSLKNPSEEISLQGEKLLFRRPETSWCLDAGSMREYLKDNNHPVCLRYLIFLRRKYQQSSTLLTLFAQYTVGRRIFATIVSVYC